MYRELSLDFFDNEENLKMRWFSGKFWNYDERPFLSVISKWIYGHLFENDIRDNDIHWKCTWHWIWKSLYFICVFTFHWVITPKTSINFEANCDNRVPRVLKIPLNCIFASADISPSAPPIQLPLTVWKPAVDYPQPSLWTLLWGTIDLGQHTVVSMKSVQSDERRLS